MSTTYDLDSVAKLDNAHSKTGKIYEELEKAKAKFQKQKEDDVKVYGGRNQTPAEKGMMTILLLLCAIL